MYSTREVLQGSFSCIKSLLPDHDIGHVACSYTLETGTILKDSWQMLRHKQTLKYIRVRDVNFFIILNYCVLFDRFKFDERIFDYYEIMWHIAFLKCISNYSTHQGCVKCEFGW